MYLFTLFVVVQNTCVGIVGRQRTVVNSLKLTITPSHPWGRKCDVRVSNLRRSQSRIERGRDSKLSSLGWDVGTRAVLKIKQISDYTQQVREKSVA